MLRTAVPAALECIAGLDRYQQVDPVPVTLFGVPVAVLPDVITFFCSAELFNSHANAACSAGLRTNQTSVHAAAVDRLRHALQAPAAWFAALHACCV